MWRLEFQRRGAPHFHLIAFLKHSDALVTWLHETWTEMLHPGDADHLKHGTHVRKADSWRHLRAYAAKYMAKEERYAGMESQLYGRVWGWEDAALLPVEPVSYLVTIREALAFRRALARAGGQRVRGRGCGGSLTGYLRASTVRRYAAALLSSAWEIEGLDALPPTLSGVSELTS
jgi:hypothetical protein